MKSLSPLHTPRPANQVRPSCSRPPALEVNPHPEPSRDVWVRTGSVLALGLAAGGALAAPAAQVQMTRSESVKALKQLNFLEQVAQEHGGSLRSDSTNPLGQLVKYQPEVVPVEALDNLSQGYNLYYYAGPEAAPVTVHSAQELKSLTGKVRQQQLEEKIEQGDYQGAARIFGDGLGDLIP
ncbi:hypothetical protein JST97_04020 [bacterium]|nr:hypothetical protein [bacterium]